MNCAYHTLQIFCFEHPTLHVVSATQSRLQLSLERCFLRLHAVFQQARFLQLLLWDFQLGFNDMSSITNILRFTDHTFHGGWPWQQVLFLIATIKGGLIACEICANRQENAHAYDLSHLSQVGVGLAVASLTPLTGLPSCGTGNFSKPFHGLVFTHPCRKLWLVYRNSSRTEVHTALHQLRPLLLQARPGLLADTRPPQQCSLVFFSSHALWSQACRARRHGSSAPSSWVCCHVASSNCAGVNTV